MKNIFSFVTRKELEKKTLSAYSELGFVEKTTRALEQSMTAQNFNYLFRTKFSDYCPPPSHTFKFRFKIFVFKTNFESLFIKYKEPLTLKYEQLIFKDDYGDWDESLILKEYQTFLSKKYKELLSVRQCTAFYKEKEDRTSSVKSIETIFLQNEDKFNKVCLSGISLKDLSNCLEALSQRLLSKVKRYRSSESYKKAHQSDVSFENLSPYDYEKQVAKSLSEMGWDTKVTKASGDQGCDVLVVKEKTRVALQCKYWSKPIGNKAVQEINAAKSFYNAQYAAVVSNQSYTPAAKLLATKLKVALLHHSQLNKLIEECNSLNRG